MNIESQPVTLEVDIRWFSELSARAWGQHCMNDPSTGRSGRM
jgi:hypothetical protein